MIYLFAQFTLDDVQRSVSCAGKRLKMRSKCFDALFELVRRPNVTISKDEFHALLWPNEFAAEASLTQLIYELRARLGDKRGELVATIPKAGYRLNAAVRNVSDQQTERQLEHFEAYELCAKARVLVERREKQTFLRARDLFAAAIEKDAAYAPAHLGLAHTWGNLGSYNYIAPGEAFPKAKAEAREALRLDPGLGRAYSVLAHCAFFYDWDWALAEELATKAVSMDPVQEVPYHTLTWLRLIFSDFERAVSHTAQGLDAFPTSLNLHSTLAIIYLFQGDAAKAVGMLRSLLEVNPQYLLARYYLGNALVTRPESVSDAVRELEMVCDAEASAQNCTSLAYALALSGDITQARTIVERLRRRSASEYIPRYSLALAYTGLGDLETAIAELKIAVEERAAWLVFLATEPRFARLRSHPEFPGILRSIGLKH